MSGEVLVGAALLAEIYRHAEEGYPREICGFIVGGKGGPLDEVRRCVNLQDQLHAEDPVTFPRDARTAYNIGGKDLLQMHRSLDGERPVRIIYHSHVDVGAYFSQEDQAAAAPDGELMFPVDFLVVDVQRSGARGAKLFRFDAARCQWDEIAGFDRG